ncbi:hypothetical protein JCM19314_134 [Nonlabens ulvanivorans]|uniref:Lipoprotein n=1 Tax=Nonlabens ulvanivorans TaxID=906888 RepID=A0A090QFA2_NONUL|nr:hypothetical protein [Nonlabens ulvanivorans]GAL00908.1 hypothetical protein JCM19314_134 [Nonlabens ulvanivorans]
MKKLVLLAFTCLAIISCEKEEVLQEKSTESMMKFKDLDEFTRTLRDLNKIQNEDELIEWANRNNPNALYFNNDEEVKRDVPRLIQFYLNTEKKCKIDNQIVTLTGNELRLKLSDSTDDYEVLGVISEETSEVEDDIAKSTSITELRKEYEQYNRVFYRNGCAPKYNKSLKYRLVHELKIKNTRLNLPLADQIFVEIYTVLRMKYKSGSLWKDANRTERLINYSFNGSINVIGGFNSPNSQIAYFNVNENGLYNCQSPATGNIINVLANYDYLEFGASPKPIIRLNGNLRHQVNGDDSNVWNHYPIWNVN